MWEKEIKGYGKINRPEHNSRVKKSYNKLVGNTEWFKSVKEDADMTARKQKGRENGKSE